jgi:hypothetical protein
MFRSYIENNLTPLFLSAYILIIVMVINITKTRGSQEPVIAHLVFNLTSNVDRKWGCYT